jgi:hypothetical protein
MMHHPYVGILTLFGDGSIEKDGWPVKRDIVGPRGCPHSKNTNPNVIAPAPRCDLSYIGKRFINSCDKRGAVNPDLTLRNY